MQASMSHSFFVVADHIGLLTPLGSIKPVAPSAPCVISCGKLSEGDLACCGRSLTRKCWKQIPTTHPKPINKPPTLIPTLTAYQLTPQTQPPYSIHHHRQPSLSTNKCILVTQPRSRLCGEREKQDGWRDVT